MIKGPLEEALIPTPMIVPHLLFEHLQEENRQFSLLLGLGPPGWGAGRLPVGPTSAGDSWYLRQQADEQRGWVGGRGDVRMLKSSTVSILSPHVSVE